EQLVVAAEAVERVVPPRPADHVGQTVAGAGHRRCALQRQVLDVVRQRIVDGRPHKVDALAGLLDHEVASVVDVVEVVAGAAPHRVGTRAAIDRVVAVKAGKPVVPGSALDHVVATKQVLEQTQQVVIDDVAGEGFDRDRRVGERKALPARDGVLSAGHDAGGRITVFVIAEGPGQNQLLDDAFEFIGNDETCARSGGHLAFDKELQICRFRHERFDIELTFGDKLHATLPVCESRSSALQHESSASIRPDVSGPWLSTCGTRKASERNLCFTRLIRQEWRGCAARTGANSVLLTGASFAALSSQQILYSTKSPATRSCSPSRRMTKSATPSPLVSPSMKVFGPAWT